MLDLCIFRDIPVKADAHFTDILNVEISLTLLVHAQLAAIAIGVLDALEAIAPIESWKAWRFSSLYLPEESPKGFVQAAQKLLKTGGIEQSNRFWMGMAQILEVRTLSNVRDTLSGFFFGLDTLLKRSIVDPARLPEQEIQSPSLLGRGAQQILVSSNYRTSVLFYLFDVNNPYKIYEKSSRLPLSPKDDSPRRKLFWIRGLWM